MTIIEQKTRIKGEYRLVLNAGLPTEKDTGWFDNLVLDNGLNMLGSGPTNWYANCSVGTGTAAPANAQTTLTAYLAQKLGITSSSASNVGSPSYAGQYTAVYTFAQGAVVGNIAEVGVGPGTGGSNLFSRSRIVDGGGTPTTLTVVALDQLTVYYRVTATPTLTDAAGSFLISGVSYNYTSRLSNAGSFMATTSAWEGTSRWGSLVTAGNIVATFSTATLGATTSAPGGTAYNGATLSMAAYSAGNFYNDCTLTFSTSQGNAPGGVGSIWVDWGNTPSNSRRHCSQMSLSPVIPKDNTKVLTIVFRYSWSR
jgi:hypothetical protein